MYCRFPTVTDETADGVEVALVAEVELEVLVEVGVEVEDPVTLVVELESTVEIEREEELAPAVDAVLDTDLVVVVVLFGAE